LIGHQRRKELTMKRVVFKKISVSSVFCAALLIFLLQVPAITFGAEYETEVNASPYIINIEAQRLGDIRIFTSLGYSFFIANSGQAFVYINGSEESVENIRATRDSRGNLILKFALEDLLALENLLALNDVNDVKVVLSLGNGDEYIGWGEVYIQGKKSR